MSRMIAALVVILASLAKYYDTGQSLPPMSRYSSHFCRYEMFLVIAVLKSGNSSCFNRWVAGRGHLTYVDTKQLVLLLLFFLFFLLFSFLTHRAPNSARAVPSANQLHARPDVTPVAATRLSRALLESRIVVVVVKEDKPGRRRERRPDLTGSLLLQGGHRHW